MQHLYKHGLAAVHGATLVFLGASSRHARAMSAVTGTERRSGSRAGSREGATRGRERGPVPHAVPDGVDQRRHDGLARDHERRGATPSGALATRLGASLRLNARTRASAAGRRDDLAQSRGRAVIWRLLPRCLGEQLPGRSSKPRQRERC